MLQNAPNCTIPKKFSGKHAPKQTLGYHTRRKQLCGMQLAQPPEKLFPLANPAYALGLLLRNLFEETRS